MLELPLWRSGGSSFLISHFQPMLVWSLEHTNISSFVWPRYTWLILLELKLQRRLKSSHCCQYSIKLVCGPMELKDLVIHQVHLLRMLSSLNCLTWLLTLRGFGYLLSILHIVIIPSSWQQGYRLLIALSRQFDIYFKRCTQCNIDGCSIKAFCFT